jgi:hypothetical protein
MNIHTDPILVKGFGQDQIRGLPSHSRQSQEFLHRCRYLILILFPEDDGDFLKIGCLGPVKPRRIHETSKDFLW